MTKQTYVDDEGIHLPRIFDGDGQTPLDVRFGAHRVWSFTVDHEGRRTSSGFVVGWPNALASELDGVASVCVVPHAGGEPLFAGQVAFGTSSEPLELVDDAGNPLSLDKGNRLQRTFDRMDDGARAELILASRRVLDDLVDRCGLDAYLSYGCLLGAAREGTMIGHDSDTDLAYLSRFTHPYDIIRECRAAEREMRRQGWNVVRMSAANFKVWVPMPNGKRAGIDVFGSFHIGDHFHITGSLRGRLDRDAIVPFRSIRLEGVEFPAPRDLERFLAFTYGAGWRVPDPAFHFDHPAENTKMMSQWFRGGRTRLHHWQEFYDSAARKRVPRGPSDFAAWAESRMEPGSRVIELGSGTGRDAFWFADRGHRITGSDYCGAAIKLAMATTGARKAAGEKPVRFRPINLESDHTMLTRAARLAHQPGAKHVYARLLIDALTDRARPNLWRFCSMLGRSGGHTFLEFRAAASQGEPTFFGNHPRTYADPDRIVAEAEARGARVVDRQEGRDLARLGEENPVVCRLELAWTRPEGDR